MRRHIPTLYAHPERNQDDVEEDDEEVENGQWRSTQMHRQSSYNTVATGLTAGGSSKTRMKPRSPNNFVSVPTAGGLAPSMDSPASSSAKYSDIYSQFIKRYRSEPGTADDARDDPENTYFQRGTGQLMDAGESEDEERPGSAQGLDGRSDRYSSLLLDSEVFEPVTLEERERLEWQSMLASVLDGDVLKSEKSRIQVALESSHDEANNRHVDIWVGLRARLRGRQEDEEKKKLEERRRVVEPVLLEIMSFRVIDGPAAPSALHQVNAVLHRLDTVQSLYPNLKAFYLDKPMAADTTFQARCDTLNSWSSVLMSLRQQINLLRKWTGSETLDVTQPNTNPEKPIGASLNRQSEHASLREHIDGSTFVERVLKEDSLQRTFEKGFLTTVHALIASARDTQVNLAAMFKELNLPTFEEELVQLISFPTRLVQACLRVRLEYSNKVKDPDVLIIDQMLEDFRLTIGLACTLKRQYEAFRFPHPGGNWNPPSCISDDYDSILLDSLNFFFKLINWKLKSGAKDIYFKETDVLEAQWATFNDVSLTVPGGAPLVAEQIWRVSSSVLYTMNPVLIITFIAL